MGYSEKVIDHFEHPRNVGSFDKNDPTVGTGLTGAPSCGDVLKLQIKINKEGIIEDARFKAFGCVGSETPIACPGRYVKARDIKVGQEVYSWTGAGITTSKVTKVLTRSVPKTDIVRIDFGVFRRKTVAVTKDHLFIRTDGTPVEAEDVMGVELFEILEAELRGLNNVGRRSWLKGANKSRMTESNPMFDREVVSRANSAENQAMRVPRTLASKPETSFERKFRERFGHLPLEFVGDGKLIVENKCPDFVVKGTHKVIDLTSDVSWRLSRRDSGYEPTRRAIFEKAGYSYFHFVDLNTSPEELERFVHNGISALSIKPLSDGRSLRGLERDKTDSSKIVMYDFTLSGPHSYFVYRVASHNCGSAIASSSLVTEWIKGKSIDAALKIKNTDVATELALPPVKIHCSVLAEDAIKAAIADYRKKKAALEATGGPTEVLPETIPA